MSEKEYNKCVNEYSEMLFKFIVKNISDTESARDLTQDAFVSLWTKHNDVEVSKAKAFLFISAHNAVVNHLDKTQKHRDIKNELLKTKERSFENTLDKRDLVNHLVEKLPLMMKECVVMRDLQGFSYKEIADVLQITQSNVKVNIFRARVMLKRMLNEEL